MLTLDPAKRITATQALDSDYFWTDPLPCEPSQYVTIIAINSNMHRLPKHPTSHEYQTKKRRAVAQQTQDLAKKPKPVSGYPHPPPPGNPPYRGGPPPQNPPPHGRNPPPHHRPDQHRSHPHPPPPPDHNKPRPPPPRQ
jgi:hypothetical protein